MSYFDPHPPARKRHLKAAAAAAFLASSFLASSAHAVSVLAPFTGAAIVTNGQFTNVYVYPNPDKESWDDHLRSLQTDVPWIPGHVPASYTQAGIDAFSADLMSGWPGYFDVLMQYRTIGQTGISPPTFLGSKVASQACVDAALKDRVNNVVQWNTLRSLANCHLDGDDPSPQVNLIISPDILVGPANWGPNSSGDLCGSSDNAYHAWGINTPNFAVLPTNSRCNPNFDSFTEAFSHEDVEILSDPAGLGYRADFYTLPGSLSDGEMADICQAVTGARANPTGSSAIAFTSYKNHQVSRYWSNFDNACEPALEGPPGTDSQIWVLGSGSPLARLTGDKLDFSLGVPADRPSTTAPLVQLRLVLQTGADDLRGGGGTNGSATVHFTTGDDLTVNINDDRRWDNDETHFRVLGIPANVRVSDITGVTISHEYDGGFLDCCGDNWNIDQVAFVVSYPHFGVQIVHPTPPTASGPAGFGLPTTFQATLTDPNASFTWASSVEGPMGSGASISYAFGTPGPRTITVTALDGNISTQTSIVYTATDVPPTAFITTPTNAALLYRNEPFPLIGGATNSVDFSFDCHHLKWSMDVLPSWSPDPCGSTSPGVDILGTAVITLTATDQYGETGSARVKVDFVPPPVGGPPGVVIAFPPPNDVFISNEAVALSGQVTDPAGGAVTYRWTIYDPSTGVETTIGTTQDIEWVPINDSFQAKPVELRLYGSSAGGTTEVSEAETIQVTVR